MLTHYLGKTIGNRVLVICKDDKGNFIQVPHVDMMKTDGLAMISLGLKKQTKNGIRYLTQKEVACFITGQGTDGSRLETPAEQQIRIKKEHEEFMKDPKYAEIYNKFKEEMERNKK